MVIKYCSDCKKNIDIQKFAKNRSKKDKHNTICIQCKRKREATRRLRDKTLVISHYTRGKMCCQCCGENIFRFLTIDHKNGTGIPAQERQQKSFDTQTLIRKIIMNNYPKDFQILCFNCNIGSYHNSGVCPHIEKLRLVRI